MNSAYVVTDNEGNVVGLYYNEEDAENCAEDHQFPASVQGPFPIEENWMP